ncbi:MAG TPA: hypothetical protein VNJ01_00110 [Bacteriovoracaceae bacterium]|nr:hypothetical protein [Bacteriovoracaceae bacterium]
MSNFLSLAQAVVKKADAHLAVHGHEEFHTRASELLLSSGMSETFNLEELVQETMRAGFTSPQTYGATQFSDLPVTLATGEGCFLDLYFWRRRPTVIHNHHFCGAFMCLEGLNLDLEFEFIQTRKLGRYHALGPVTLKHTNHLKKGDVKSIPFLDRFIHQNHHHSDLSINVCLRTPELGESNLSNYLFSGLKYDKDPWLLSRHDRLEGFLRLCQTDFEKLDLDIDDSLYFVIQNFHSSSENMRFKKLYQFLLQKIITETGVDILGLLKEHESCYDRIQAQYD